VTNRLFVAIVVVLWLITMSWLVVVKILPPLDQGLPPSYRGLRAGTESCWKIYWNERSLGWAVNRVDEASHGTKEIYSRLLLDRVPLADLAPSLIASLVENVGEISLDAKSRVELDTLGSLSGFEVTLAINDVAVTRMTGRVENSELLLRIRAGDFTHKEHRFFPQDARLGGELTPDGRMPGMYVGRRWKMQVFSPFRPPTDPVELVEGEVVGNELIHFGGGTVTARRVEYRRLASAGVASGNDVRGILWVAEDGRVLRQEVNVFNAKVRFERVEGPDAERRIDRLLAPSHGLVYPPRERRENKAPELVPGVSEPSPHGVQSDRPTSGDSGQ
jgi:hypothetical protein